MGIIGAVVVIIGMFMKIISIYGIGFSYFDVITSGSDWGFESTMVMICFAAVGVAIAGGVLYFLSKNQIGRILSIVGIVLFLFSIFAGLDLGDLGDIIGYLGLGFWLMLIGYIVMILSMTLKNVNEKIDAAIGGNKQ